MMKAFLIIGFCAANVSYAKEVETRYAFQVWDELVRSTRCDEVTSAFDAVGRRMLGETGKISARDELIYAGAITFEKGFALGAGVSETSDALRFCLDNPAALYIQAFQ
ncbi:hypothetical protein [Marivita sp.]|uniref:hypothetical protein n=1 Tax=Marivita sp. TaxID=2003365 RepID=UPI003F6E5A09